MMPFENWCISQWPTDVKEGTLRLGQSYLNNVKPKMIYPELFYETDQEKAWGMIMDLEGAGK